MSRLLTVCALLALSACLSATQGAFVKPDEAVATPPSTALPVRTDDCELERSPDADFPFVVVEPGEENSVRPAKRSFLCLNHILVRECDPGSFVEYGAENGVFDKPIRVIAGEFRAHVSEWRAFFTPAASAAAGPVVAKIWTRCVPGSALE
jgi:hypothetical protein